MTEPVPFVSQVVSVRPALPPQWKLVWPLMFGGFSPAERAARTADVLDAVRRGELCLDGLLLAWTGDRPVGVGLYVLQPDRTAFVWPPVVGHAASVPAHPADADAGSIGHAQVADALLADICRRLDDAGVRFAQCLLEPDQTADRERLVCHGFTHVADVSTLQRPLDAPLPSVCDIGLTTIRFDPATNRDLFAAVLERTYAGSQDCPALAGARSGAEALKGHRTSGEFDPRLWRLLRAGEEVVGVLLLANHPELRAWEVVYLGVVPEARGRGYGRQMLTTALHEAREAGREAMFLAVDRQNLYAVRLYEELGFVEQSVRAVHLRPSGGSARE